MVDENFNLQVADFGLCAPLEGRTGSGLLHTNVGTEMYKAPEIIAKEPYQGNSVDLFAAIICCFALRAGSFPFGTANASTDSLYRFIQQDRWDKFWNYHKRQKPSKFYSENFMNLMTTMLGRQPSQRLNLADVLGHPWFSEETATAE